MPRLRVLLLWILLLAVPFQGAVAAAMVVCGMPQPAQVGAAQAASHHADPDAHAMHAHHGAAMDRAQAADHHGQPGQADSGVVHKCSVCSACHAAALLDMPVAREPLALPQPTPLTSPDTLASLAPRLPDKPPRA